MHTFWARVEERNKHRDQEKIEPDILCCHDAAMVSSVMHLFLLKVCKADGEKYLPATIQNLLSELRCKMIRNKVPFSMMDKTDRQFCKLTLNSVSTKFVLMLAVRVLSVYLSRMRTYLPLFFNTYIGMQFSTGAT